jgi:hypothetical protein
MNAQYGHARNNRFLPPITIEVENGVVTKLTIERFAAENYTGDDIMALIEAAGAGPARVSLPIPEAYMNVPLNQMRFHLRPGTYEVRHVRNDIFVPEAAVSVTALQ